MTHMGGSGDSSVPEGHIPTSRIQGYATGPATVDGPRAETAASPSDDVIRRGREFASILGEFRRRPVLLPLADDGSPLTNDFGGVRWILAFSDEATLARFAVARGEGARERAYQAVLGARLLDGFVPALDVPCGVALDVGSHGDEVLFPPVAGIVPDAAAVGPDDSTNGEVR
ncbi:hypothetical protein ACWCP6_05275 [Streptomyces sp. NPDC002004]